MLALRQPGRSLLARTIARVLIAALVFALVPFDASAATRSPALAQPELPGLEYVMADRSARGQGLVYELVYDGAGRDWLHGIGFCGRR